MFGLLHGPFTWSDEIVPTDGSATKHPSFYRCFDRTGRRVGYVRQTDSIVPLYDASTCSTVGLQGEKKFGTYNTVENAKRAVEKRIG